MLENIKPISIEDIKKGDLIIERERGGFLRSCVLRAEKDAYRSRKGWEALCSFVSGDTPMMENAAVMLYSADGYSAYGPDLYRIDIPSDCELIDKCPDNPVCSGGCKYYDLCYFERG